MRHIVGLPGFRGIGVVVVVVRRRGGGGGGGEGGSAPRLGRHRRPLVMAGKFPFQN